MPELNYFVCTLGEAALFSSRPFKNVIDLVNQQARKHGDLPAVGFYVDSRDSGRNLNYEILTFADVRRGVLNVADNLSKNLDLSPRATVGFLCGSSPEFLFTWLALIYLGHPVLLIAPQCSPSAITSLCETCEATVLIVDEKNQDLANKARSAAQNTKFRLQPKQLLQIIRSDIFQLVRQRPNDNDHEAHIKEDDIAYYFHSSGTSSGTPKPIAQSHRSAVACLPASEGSSAATFTTTPLYHGGIADVFRAWTSSALIWLFPGSNLPITAPNVIKCLDVADQAASERSISPVKYFSSVPYVLQMLAEDDKGLYKLRAMEIVGVGGAALPEEAGDRLVKQGVNLVSRYGSAECGFLMSSHRDYEHDKEWLYLRAHPSVKELRLEPAEDTLSELVVGNGWPHIAKTNRNDGSYATADLFISHRSIPNAWRYHSRADSQLTLNTGKKFDPAPLEDALTNSTESIHDTFIFGDGMAYPGALIFRSEKATHIQDEELLKEVTPIIEKLNQDSQKHARIPRNMLRFMPFDKEPLEKSSKGTILRSLARERYSSQIEQAYKVKSVVDHCYVPDSEVEDKILELVSEVVGKENDNKLETDTDLFDYGVDSVASVQIRNALKSFLPQNVKSLPLTFVEDAGTVSRLADAIISRRHGYEIESKEDQRAIIPSLVEEYSHFTESASSIINGQTTLNSLPAKQTSGLTVLLTGPTGFLGVHVLSQLLARVDITHIYLLVRGVTHHAARERVMKALAAHRLHVPPDFDERVTVMSCKLSDANLGISSPDYEKLTHIVDVIMHLAWSVNFLLSLRSFRQHLAGLKNLLNFALASSKPIPPTFVFCSSIASVSNFQSLPDENAMVPETICDVSSCGTTGYASSKLTGELICAEAAKSTRMSERITIIRVGQLSGDTNTGIWNKSEAYPLILSSVNVTGILPDLGGEEKLTWLPVNGAAKCFIDAMLNSNPFKLRNEDTFKSAAGLKVLHLINSSSKMEFIDLLRILQKNRSFKILSAPEWLSQLEQKQDDEKSKSHPAFKLLPFWKQSYGQRIARSDDALTIDLDNSDHPLQSRYEMKQSFAAMPSLASLQGVLQEEYIWKLWNWIESEIN